MELKLKRDNMHTLKIGTLFSVFMLMSCSGDGGKQWPSLESDALWQRLTEQRDAEPAQPTATVDQDMAEELSKIPVKYYVPPVRTEAEIAARLAAISPEVDKLLGALEEAYVAYEKADGDQNSQAWRTLQFHISRLNDRLNMIKQDMRDLEKLNAPSLTAKAHALDNKISTTLKRVQL